MALLAGCGDDGDDPSPAPRTTGEAGQVTKAAWRAQVNAVCRRNRDETLRVAAEVSDEGLTGRAAAAETIERGNEAQRELVDDLLAVPAPTGLRSEFQRFGEGIRRALPLLDRLSDDIRAGRDDPRLTTQLAQIAGRTRPFAIDNGITDCLPDQAG